jgi:rhodanese-related sulfurtransferase
MKRLILMAALTGAAAPLVAQQPVSAALAGHVPDAVVHAVQVYADSATALGLPTRPLVNKALEGGVKNVPAERIVTAVGQVLGQLSEAAQALRPAGGTAPDVVEAGAFALAAGLEPGDIATVARSAGRNYPAATALRVAGTIAALGVPRDEATDLVKVTESAGQPVADLVNLPSRVQELMSHGTSASKAASDIRAAALGSVPKAGGRPGVGRNNPHRP